MAETKTALTQDGRMGSCVNDGVPRAANVPCPEQAWVEDPSSGKFCAGSYQIGAPGGPNKPTDPQGCK